MSCAVHPHHSPSIHPLLLCSAIHIHPPQIQYPQPTPSRAATVTSHLHLPASMNSSATIAYIAALLALIQADKVPTAANIEEYDDPMLDEIFAEANSRWPDDGVDIKPPPIMMGGGKDQLESLSPAALVPPSSAGAPAVAVAGTGVLDPNRKPAPGAVFSHPGSSPDQPPIGGFGPGNELANGFSTLGSPSPAGQAGALFQGPLADLTAQGAHSFYNGIRTAGRLLGIDAGQYQPYEVPLISNGARFFGRKR